jgi:hypothetical protein
MRELSGFVLPETIIAHFIWLPLSPREFGLIIFRNETGSSDVDLTEINNYFFMH